MTYLEKLTLYLCIHNRGTFIDSIHLPNEIIFYMPRLHLFTFYISTYGDTDDLFRYVPSQDIQYYNTLLKRERGEELKFRMKGNCR
jgi:hypothetical protein